MDQPFRVWGMVRSMRLCHQATMRIYGEVEFGSGVFHRLGFNDKPRTKTSPARELSEGSLAESVVTSEMALRRR